MSSQHAPGWQKRVDRQKEHANRNLTSWFLKTFSSGKKTQFIREQDEASAQAERQQRRPAGASPTQGLGQLSAVANATQHGGGTGRRDHERRTPQRQRSFLRQQLMEMKRQSAETLLRTQQQRMDGEITEEDLAALEAEQRFSDDEEDEDEDEDDEFDSDAETVQEVDEALGNLRLSSIDAPDPAASTSSMASSTQVRSRRSSSAASSSSSAGKRRSKKKLSRRSSSARSDDAKTDGELADSELAEREQRAEYSLEVSRRLSQATQLYAEAINALDSALNPDEFYRRQPMPEPQPLLLGNKKSSKSEWI